MTSFNALQGVSGRQQPQLPSRSSLGHKQEYRTRVVRLRGSPAQRFQSSRGAPCHAVTVAGKMKKQQKALLKRSDAQRDRLQELASSLESTPTPVSLAAVVRELQELNQQLQGTLQEDCSSSSSSSCSEDSEDELEMPTTSTSVETCLQQLDLALGSARSRGQALVQDPGSAPPFAATPDEALAHSSGATVHKEVGASREAVDDNDAVAAGPSGRVVVCMGKECRKQGAEAVLKSVSARLSGTAVDVVPCKCLGQCGKGPTMRVRLNGQRSVLLTGAPAGEKPVKERELVPC